MKKSSQFIFFLIFITSQPLVCMNETVESLAVLAANKISHLDLQEAEKIETIGFSDEVSCILRAKMKTKLEKEYYQIKLTKPNDWSDEYTLICDMGFIGFCNDQLVKAKRIEVLASWFSKSKREEWRIEFYKPDGRYKKSARSYYYACGIDWWSVGKSKKEKYWGELESFKYVKRPQATQEEFELLKTINPCKKIMEIWKSSDCDVAIICYEDGEKSAVNVKKLFDLNKTCSLKQSILFKKIENALQENHYLRLSEEEKIQYEKLDSAIQKFLEPYIMLQNQSPFTLKFWLHFFRKAWMASTAS